MATTSEALAAALQHHLVGRLDQAEQIYRQILAAEPDQPDAWHLLGVIAHQAGQHNVAVQYIRRAIALRGDAAAYHNNLATAYFALLRAPEAIACYRRALELSPDYAEAHYNLGNALRKQESLAEAVACYRRALELRPDYAAAHGNLGVALKEQGKLDEAVACYRRALDLKPDDAEAWSNLGVALKDQQKLDEALAALRRAGQLKPDSAEVQCNLGVALSELGDADGGVACLRRAIQLHPDFAQAHTNLGLALTGLGRLDEAVACCRRAVELKPDCAVAHNNLGNVLRIQGRLDDAVASFLAAVHLQPDLANAHNNLGAALSELGELPRALASFRRALQLQPQSAMVHSNLLHTLHYDGALTPAALARAHIEFDRVHAAPVGGALVPHDRVRAGHSPLRLGFVSPDLGRHPVGYFLVRVLENLRHQRQETVCYSDRLVKDDLTRRLQAACTAWRDVAGMSDQQLAQQIRADRVDVLFDLAGHTAHNRLLALARKPAALQITWAGYAGTTGLAAMDYILADRWQLPPEAEPFCSERALRMPDGYVCYDPPADAPPVTPLPALAPGAVTLSGFHNPAKVGPGVVELWSRILRRLPAARLVLRFRGWSEDSVVRRYTALFAGHGIGPERLELLGPAPHAELLGEYGRVDLALDPFPYSGGLTTCEALWMGVPVITCPGATFAGRHALSHLSNVGLTQTIARNLDEYVEIAVALANDLPRLAALRAGLRQRVAASPLCDGPRFAANLAALLRDVWRRWCAGGKDEG